MSKSVDAVIDFITKENNLKAIGKTKVCPMCGLDTTADDLANLSQYPGHDLFGGECTCGNSLGFKFKDLPEHLQKKIIAEKSSLQS